MPSVPTNEVLAVIVVPVIAAAEAAPITVPSIAPLSMSMLVIFWLPASKAPPSVVAVSVVNVPAAADEPPMTELFTVPPLIVRLSATYASAIAVPVSYTHLTLPTILLV